jgi:hypothetical protein
MFENVKLFVEISQEYYDYEGYGSADVPCIWLGPKDASMVKLNEEWRRDTWQARTYHRKGILRTGKQKYPTISFHDWLLKEKGFTKLDKAHWEAFGND